MDLGLANATAVVQGGTQGMGRSAAVCFAEDGARVAVLARTKADLDATTELLRAKGSPDAVALQADITDDDQVRSAFDEVRERWGELNILVNATGPGSVGGFEDLTDDQWDEAIDVGAMGMVRCVRAALPLLRRAEWARIVNVSAHSTKRQSPSLVAYTAAKSMMTSVSKNLSVALAPEEILVNTVSPGSFASETLKGWARSAGRRVFSAIVIPTSARRHCLALSPRGTDRGGSRPSESRNPLRADAFHPAPSVRPPRPGPRSPRRGDRA